MNDSQPLHGPRNPSVLLLGPTGAGKTPLGDTIEARGLWGMSCLHFDFGANLRAVVSEYGGVESSHFSPAEIAFLRDVLESAALLEDEHFPLAERILRRFLDTRGAGEDTCIVLNGLPRHVGQARAIEGVLDVRTVVVLECSEATVRRRIEGNVGGDRQSRSDDDPAAVRRKIELFRKRTEPLVDDYRQRGIRIEHVAVGPTTTAEEAWRALDARPPGPFADRVPRSGDAGR
jgi:adenylate kinase family enzyme